MAVQLLLKARKVAGGQQDPWGGAIHFRHPQRICARKMKSATSSRWLRMAATSGWRRTLGGRSSSMPARSVPHQAHVAITDRLVKALPVTCGHRNFPCRVWLGRDISVMLARWSHGAGGAVSASSDPCLASAAKAAFCGALAAGAVMEIPLNSPRRSTLRCGQCRPCGLDCCVAKTRHHCGCYFAQRLAVPRDARCSLGRKVPANRPGVISGLNPIAGSKEAAAGEKKARRGTCGFGVQAWRNARQALSLSTGEQLAWAADLVLGGRQSFRSVGQSSPRCEPARRWR